MYRTDIRPLEKQVRGAKAAIEHERKVEAARKADQDRLRKACFRIGAVVAKVQLQQALDDPLTRCACFPLSLPCGILSWQAGLLPPEGEEDKHFQPWPPWSRRLRFVPHP